MADKNSISENDLDELLQDLYLEENNSSSSSKEANFILSQEYDAIINPAKEQELIHRLQKGKGGQGNAWIIYSMLVIAAIGVFGAYVFNTKNNQPDNSQSSSPESSSSSLRTNSETTSAQNTDQNSYVTTDSISSIKIADTFDHQPGITSAVKTEPVIGKVKHIPVENPLKQQEKKVPFLTEKDKLKYRHIKLQMVVALLKLNKGLYTKVPTYKTSYAGQSMSIDGFAIRNTGITNLEYKTFLADLLAQNRDGDYLKCQVLNENWSKQGYPNLANTYFQDKTYNDFPVVNVSYEAAKLFCKWMEDETKAYIIQNNLKLKPIQIRLPDDEEWVFAAREGYAKVVFEKGYNTIYDEGVGLINRTFTNRVELVKKHAERVDTLYSYYATNRYDWNEKEIIDFFNTGLSYYNPEPFDTIYVDRMKGLGKFGHVSEMVPQKNTSRLWLSGLSWKTKEDYKKLENEFKVNASSPFVGFRIIVININDPEYKNQSW